MVRIKRTWTDTDLINAVRKSSNLSEVADVLNLVRSGSYGIIKHHIKRLLLDTSHFVANRKTSQKRIDDLFIENGSYNDYKRVKEIILKDGLLEYKCSRAECNISEWYNQKIVLQLDHINGVKTDNRLVNLRLLCPNCHSQTNNFCGKNRKITKKKYHCIVCQKEVHKKSVFCKDCKKYNMPTKIDWPSITELEDLIQTLGYSGAGRKLGVSDNAIRKHIKKMGSSPNGMVTAS